jgi:hypothetical protein
MAERKESDMLRISGIVSKSCWLAERAQTLSLVRLEWP